MLVLLTGLFLFSAIRCDAQIFHKKKKINKSTSAENTAEPDKILYDKAMDDIKHGRQEVGRLNMQTLINTYPDSEYLAKAKLAIADSYFKEGGKANMTQAIQAYKDFIVFFPFMTQEAAYAQLQVAMAHYRQMEKPDRDRSESRAAEDEFQTYLQKYPNDPLEGKAEQHLREVQEVLAEGDFRIGYYYFVKGDKKAAEARLRSVTQPISAIQQGGSRPLDAWKHLGRNGKEGIRGQLLCADCAQLSALATGSGCQRPVTSDESAGTTT